MIEPWLYPVLTGVAFVTGFIDAIAGGGGLIMMPALLVSGVPPLFALGTNKLQSMCGTFVAMRNYAAKGLIEWRPNLPTALVVFAGAVSGALLVQHVEARTLALVIPLLLLANAVYILVSPRMSDEDAHQRVSASGYAPLGGVIGLYDGFFGPGTGSFFTSTLVALRGYGLTRATALTKFFNWISNVAAVLLFAIGGKVLWLLGLNMAVGAMAGGWLGSHAAMRHGAKLIRPLLVTASIAMTGRLLWGYLSA
ncbi:TSUP family transporter [Sphingomonas humi]|uniref:Probable membrane transporter protein n=1 Tax=Sphingomonas humi TaxID=335630 RepID=A0ABP7S7X0_9SPHN